MQSVTENRIENNIKEPLSLFNARARYFMIRSKLQDFSRYMDAIKQFDHPAILDLTAWYANLCVVNEAMLPIYSKKNNRSLGVKDLRSLSNLELLMLDFQGTLFDCYSELTQIS